MLDELTKQQKLIILGLALLIFSGLGVMAFRRSFGSNSGEIVISQISGKEKEEEKAKVVVHVSGAVAAEGVYQLKPGDRVLDAVQAAGGARPLADLSRLNLAEKAKDGQQIVVPAKQAVGLTAGLVAGEGNNININTADEKKLCEISGVGKVTAKKIISYRAKTGLFQKIEDIMKVKGIGKGTFERIKDEITI